MLLKGLFVAVFVIDIPQLLACYSILIKQAVNYILTASLKAFFNMLEIWSPFLSEANKCWIPISGFAVCLHFKPTAMPCLAPSLVTEV